MKEGISLFLKGAAMGAANVIPGVSGGTVAFITGIYERMIHAIKGIDSGALKLLVKRDFRGFSGRIDLPFLFWLGIGVVVSILTLASLLEYLFEHHEIYVWSFFFGLILASIYFVGKQVKTWSAGPVVGFLIGASIAVGVALLKPGTENDSVWYLVICGIVAMASMIIPGLSGSFVLLLMGNYQLIMIESVSGLKSLDKDAVFTLIPVGIGAVLGLLLLSRALAWVFQNHHDLAVALLTGFVAGSLLIIWPWKNEVVETFEAAGQVKEKVIGYDWYFPGAGASTWIAVAVMLAGFVIVWLMEKSGGTLPEEGEDVLEESDS